MRSIEFSDGFTSSGAPVGGTLPAGGSQDFENAGVSGSPSSGYSRLHFDTNGLPVKRNSSGTDLNIATIPTSSANKAVYVDSSGYLASETALDETRGGTGQSAITTGDILYGSASNTLSKRAAGTNGHYLKMVAGIPEWALAQTVAIAAKTTTYTATATDDVIHCSASGGSWTLTLPAAASNSGKMYYIKKTDSSANTVTVDGNSSETIDGASTFVLRLQNECIQITSDGTNWIIVGSHGQKVYLLYTNNGGTALTAGTTNTDFSTVVVDTHSAWSGTVFTAPVAGFYNFFGNVSITTTINTDWRLFIGGVEKLAAIGSTATQSQRTVGPFSWYMAAGDTASFRVSNNCTLSDSATGHWISISNQGTSF